MLATDPDSDVTKPFPISGIIRGAEYVLSPYRFDQHLSRKTNHQTSDTESSEEEIPTRHSRRHFHKDYIPSPSSTDEESDEPVRRKEHKPRFKSPPP